MTQEANTATTAETTVHFEVDEDNFDIRPPDGQRAFISVCDNVLSDEDCTKMIELFEDANEHHRKINTEARTYTEVNFFDPELSEKFPEFEEFSMKLLTIISEYTEMYRRHNNIMFFPGQCVNEEIKMKKYTKGSADDFKYHSDVGDHLSAKRFVACFFYLNDVEEGGETVFPDYNLSVNPVKGRLAIWPPFWTHPHQCMPAKSDDKYVVGTYLHYM